MEIASKALNHHQRGSKVTYAICQSKVLVDRTSRIHSKGSCFGSSRVILHEPAPSILAIDAPLLLLNLLLRQRQPFVVDMGSINVRQFQRWHVGGRGSGHFHRDDRGSTIVLPQLRASIYDNVLRLAILRRCAKVLREPNKRGEQRIKVGAEVFQKMKYKTGP
jgi:hypothetical protein